FLCSLLDEVAAITKKQLAKSASRNSLFRQRICLLRAHSCILAVALGATTCTPAPASSRLAIFDWPIAPAPTTKHFRPFSLRKRGNSLSIYLLLAVLALSMSLAVIKS